MKKPYKSVKKTQKRKFVKKTPKATLVRPIVNMGKGFPLKMLTTLKYKEYVFLSSASGVLNTYHFLANSIYDPNSTGTGHQPMGTDQYFAMYNHVHIIGSKIKATILHTATANVVPMACGIYLQDDTTVSSTSYTALAEQTQSKMKILGASASDDREVLTCKYSAKKQFGGSILANNALRHSASANPSETSVFNVYIQSLDATTSASVYAWVEIDYICIFSELKDFAQS